jgi:hypothetical protein
MEDQLVGYLLNALDADQKEQVESYLRQHPESEQKLELLRQAMQPLLLDSAGAEPPPGLADRTITHVAKHRYDKLPTAPPPRVGGGGMGRPFWRRADVLIAASLLILAGGVAVTWINQARYSAGITYCENDLHDIYGGMVAHKDKSGKLPNVHNIAKPPRDVAGLMIPKLIAAGYLPKKFTMKCPGAKPTFLPLTYDQALGLSDPEFTKQAGSLTPCYGFALGYRDKDGNLHGPQFDANPDSVLTVLAADGPPADPLTGNSPNHAGKGQNVLFLNGNVKFCTDRANSFKGDDLYLNKMNKVGAGLDWHDNVIGDSRARP